MTPDGAGQPYVPPALPAESAAVEPAGPRGRLGRTGRRVAVTAAVTVGVVGAALIGQYLFGHAWTTHVTRKVNHSTFHGFWYGGWVAFLSVLAAAVLVRLAFVRRFGRGVRIGAVVLALLVLVPEFYSIGISFSDARPGTNAGRIHNDAPGYLGGQYTGMALGLAAVAGLLVLLRQWRSDRAVAKQARGPRRPSPPPGPPPGTGSWSADPPG
jgi:hypothetical protein